MTPTRRQFLKTGTMAVVAGMLPFRRLRAETKGQTMDRTQEDALIDQIAKGVSYAFRTPILRRPSDYGMAYEDVFFPAMDGVMLDGWFIPAEGSNKLIICNHFIGANRYGYPGHLEPWTGQGGFEVNFIEAYKALHDAGYNVLAYDLRGHGHSADGAGNITGVGAIEWRDVIGSVRFAREKVQGAKIALHSLCMGCNSTFIAMEKHPEEFQDIACMIALQPLSAAPFIERALTDNGVENAVERFDERYSYYSSFRHSDSNAIARAHSVKCPTMVVQVKDDLTTKPSDAEGIFAKLPNSSKKLHWIEGTPVRYEGYRYFSQSPAEMIAWYDAHM
ncbi:MAG: alpha/beta fold hydrolase [Pseudomonadota bacterium]